MKTVIKIILLILSFLYGILSMGSFFIGGKYPKSNILVFGLLSLMSLLSFVFVNKKK